MGRKIAQFLESLPTTWKALTALGAAFGLGWAVAVSALGFWTLPDQVSANTKVILEHSKALQDLARRDSTNVSDIRRIRCVVEAMATHDDPVRRCGL